MRFCAVWFSSGKTAQLMATALTLWAQHLHCTQLSAGSITTYCTQKIPLELNPTLTEQYKGV